jgi:formylglycine-generating enzyme required for sulfatase activity
MSEQTINDAPEAERTLGHYRLLESIGRGGMAVVYRALDASSKREVAINVLPDHFAQTPQMVARFEREVGIAAQLEHPGIVRVLDHGQEGPTLYVVMEYVQGESLDKVIARGRLPLEDVIDWAIQLCEALQYAHGKDVIHRHLKPANVLLDKKSGRVKIADFGVAGLQADSGGVLGITWYEISPGTLQYMSPEQQLDPHRVTHHTDIYAFGAMLYEMLTGRVPVGHFRPASLVRNDIPMAIDGIVSRCMAELPADRYQSAGEIRADLLRLTGRQGKGRRGNATAPHGARGRRSALRYVGVVAVLALILAGALYVVKPWQPKAPATSGPAGAMAAQTPKEAGPPPDAGVALPAAVNVDAAGQPTAPVPAESMPPGMVRVAGGQFPLGMDRTGPVAPSNSPQHMVALDSFCIGVYEVTNAQFAAFVSAGGYGKDEYWAEAQGVSRAGFVDSTGQPGPKYWVNGTFPGDSGDLPVAGVSWYEAAAYAHWAGMRLPTEAEWECAGCGVPEQAGAGYVKRAFPWGDQYVAGRANLSDGRRRAPSPVNSWPGDKSPAGCYDMAGNVREWTASPYLPYPGSECQDEAFGKGLAVVRGSSFGDSQDDAELTSRRGTEKLERDPMIGFRCAWSPPVR